MVCPDGFGQAIRRCPFLHGVAATQGESYAASLAGKTAGPVPLSEADDERGFLSTLKLFHGPKGVYPLEHVNETYSQPSKTEEPVSAVLHPPKCPFAHAAEKPAAPLVAALAAAPLASMSMSWGSDWFNIHHLLKKHLSQQRAAQRKPPQQPQQQPRTGPGGAPGPGPNGPGAPGLRGPGPLGASLGAGASAAAAGGTCPMRKALGPLAGLVFNKHGHFTCPEPIIKMRAMLAATKPVRELRPQALPVKLFAVALTTAALNVPCGMWRQHTEKFSSQWFVAVHATIPFIAMLRKAVIMPKYAILFTICAAIAGQAMGAKLERKRMVAEAKAELGGLSRATPVPLARPQPSARHSAAPAPLPVASLLLSSQQLQSNGGGASSISSSGGGGGGGMAAAGGAALMGLGGGSGDGDGWMWGLGAEAAAGLGVEGTSARQLTFRMRARSGCRVRSPVAGCRLGAGGARGGGVLMLGRSRPCRSCVIG